MAENLQKQGPAVLITLSQNDLLHLVDLLISDKKWVEECPLQTFPFKVIHAAAKSSYNNAPSSNGLSSLFNGTSLHSSSHIVPESGKQRLQNPSNVEVPPPAINKKLSSKSRGEILADCQKLVDGILKEYPEGFNTASFRKLFLDTYGYSLDLQMLGYQKLVNLLQVMHGVKIESGCILPARKVWKSSSLDVSDSNLLRNVSGILASSDGELSDASRKDDDLESPWEELGPVSSTVPKRSGMELGLKRKKKEGAPGQASNDYEPLSDDVFSDSDDETLSSSESECQRKPKVNEEDSSLLQILDNWYSCKEDNSRRVASEDTNTVTDCYGNVTKQSSSSGGGVNSENPALNYARKQKPSKSYLFVSDQVDDNKDRLIDGILGSLKNSGNDTTESRI
ncbi:hypothetical protein RJ640_009997 [Escallonia rubra]|uniref:HTH OST-type domain-containing protein n=1 Tax=Escallonia rubra TaxID=112253 RepID=A0AA88S3R5_9ASTE|nr:hypothetical protein RJ640_009997 [Escallonia rubra]